MMNMHSYSYDYDGLGRLSSSAHFINGSLVDENFETGFRYDRNGNLLALQRYGIVANPFTHDYLADDLSYAYCGNRLEHITNRALPQDEVVFQRVCPDFHSTPADGRAEHIPMLREARPLPGCVFVAGVDQTQKC